VKRLQRLFFPLFCCLFALLFSVYGLIYLYHGDDTAAVARIAFAGVWLLWAREVDRAQ
jgi:hypothetical protein